MLTARNVEVLLVDEELVEFWSYSRLVGSGGVICAVPTVATRIRLK